MISNSDIIFLNPPKKKKEKKIMNLQNNFIAFTHLSSHLFEETSNMLDSPNFMEHYIQFLQFMDVVCKCFVSLPLCLTLSSTLVHIKS